MIAASEVNKIGYRGEQKMNMKPKYVAHRGLSLHAPENTIPAFELAGKSGFWGIECDTYCTTNGRWIVHHDRTVDRMTNGTGRTKDFSYEEIRKLHIVAGNGIDAYSNLQIPTLEEVLSVCLSYGMHAFIEIEEYHQDRDGEASFACPGFRYAWAMQFHLFQCR